MRATVCALVAAIGLAVHPALAQPRTPPDKEAAAFWKKVQATCNATAAKPPGELGKRIAQTAIDEFNGFDGHRIDSNGRLFRFGLTEAEHEEDDGGAAQASVGHLGWWQVMKYWRALFADDPPGKLEVRGYDGASSATDDAKEAEVLRTSAARLLEAVESVSDPELREILREAALRSAVTDTSWSAAFISYVVKQSGAGPYAFPFSNAHRTYIYDAFATSGSEIGNEKNERIYRACPLTTTRLRPGDMICNQRESALAGESEAAVRERIRSELGGGPETRTVRRTHCEVVAFVDARTRRAYTIGGNVNQSVTARKINLRRGLKFSPSQGSSCGGAARWTLPEPSAQPNGAAHAAEKCSLNDKKWFVLLQLR